MAEITREQIESARLEGIRLGLEAIRKMVAERMDSLRVGAHTAGYSRRGSELAQRASEAYEIHQWLSTVTASDIAAKAAEKG